MPSKTLGASILSSNVSRSVPSPIWTSWLNLMQSVHKLPGIAFFLSVLCCLIKRSTCLALALLQSLMEKRTGPLFKFPRMLLLYSTSFFLLSLSLFFKKLLCLFIYHI